VEGVFYLTAQNRVLPPVFPLTAGFLSDSNTTIKSDRIQERALSHDFPGGMVGMCIEI